MTTLPPPRICAREGCGRETPLRKKGTDYMKYCSETCERRVRHDKMDPEKIKAYERDAYQKKKAKRGPAKPKPCGKCGVTTVFHPVIYCPACKQARENDKAQARQAIAQAHDAAVKAAAQARSAPKKAAAKTGPGSGVKAMHTNRHVLTAEERRMDSVVMMAYQRAEQRGDMFEVQTIRNNPLNRRLFEGVKA